MREGLIPTVLGTVVTAASATVKGRSLQTKKPTKKSIAGDVTAGLIGFGLAHIVLGTIDLIQENK